MPNRPFSTFTKSRKPINPFSKKTLDRRGAREQCIHAVWARDERCRLDRRSPHYPGADKRHLLGWLPQCGGGQDTHEPLTRGRGGDETDPDQCIALCRYHHDWVHLHQDESHDLGLLIHSWDHSSSPSAGRPVPVSTASGSDERGAEAQDAVAGRGGEEFSDPATVRPSRPTDTGAEVDEAAFPGGQVPGRRFAE